MQYSPNRKPIETYHQLCLPLTELEVTTAGRKARPIPSKVLEVLALSDTSPSGLVWAVSGRGRVKGQPAGSPFKPNGKDTGKWQVSVYPHGLFYAHRIVHFLKTGQNPGSMVVRHLGDETVLGWQQDNGSDEKHFPKSNYKTKVMYRLGPDGEPMNLSMFCRRYKLPYHTVYQRLRTLKWDPSTVFDSLGLGGVEVVTP